MSLLYELTKHPSGILRQQLENPNCAGINLRSRHHRHDLPPRCLALADQHISDGLGEGCHWQPQRLVQALRGLRLTADCAKVGRSCVGRMFTRPPRPSKSLVQNEVFGRGLTPICAESQP